jgi:hypothetical protein
MAHQTNHEASRGSLKARLRDFCPQYFCWPCYIAFAFHSGIDASQGSIFSTKQHFSRVSDREVPLVLFFYVGSAEMNVVQRTSALNLGAPT